MPACFARTAARPRPLTRRDRLPNVCRTSTGRLRRHLRSHLYSTMSPAGLGRPAAGGTVRLFQPCLRHLSRTSASRTVGRHPEPRSGGGTPRLLQHRHGARPVCLPAGAGVGDGDNLDAGVFGPRSASKTAAFQVPPDLPPDLPADIMPGRVTRVETLAGGLTVPLSTYGHFHIWREFVEADVAAEIRFETADGFPAMIRRGSVDYLCGWPDGAFLKTILSEACSEAGLRLHGLPEGVRLRQVGDTGFLVNYSDARSRSPRSARISASRMGRKFCRLQALR